MTWGHASNTWTGSGGLWNNPERIDYALYTHGNSISVRTSSYNTVNAKTEKDGEMISLSDHMWAQANLRIDIS